jgi:sugar phosphate isomerase/epimerase
MSIPVALQLYTVRDQTAKDFAGTLRRVAEIGYGAVELVGYGGLSTEALVDLLAETGLRAASTHVGVDALEADLDREIAVCSAIGCTNLVLPWLPPERRGAEAMDALAPRLNQIGRRCREQGIAFAYHNHDFEFAQVEGRPMLDRLLESTDPALVGLELDVYWAAYANVEPVGYLREHADRIRLLHLKDLGADRRFAEVGEGTLDIGAICAAAEAAGVRWLIVEHDQPTMPSLESARRSLENLRRMNLA